MQLTRTLLALTALAAGTAAQAGGFVDGDLFLSSRNVAGPGSQDGGLVAIDPLSGQTELLVDYAFSSYGHGTLAFDSYRKRMVFWTSIDQGGPQYGLWTADAAGNLERAVATVQNTIALAPSGDGKIYCVTPQIAAAPFQYYDAANVRHRLMNAAGDGPFSFSGIANSNDTVMTYDAGTNALFVAYRGSSGPSCTGGSAYGTTIKKLPLSADGTRVVGPVECREHDADLVQSTEVPVGWSRGPGSALLLVIDTTGTGSETEPRVARVDPASFTVSTFATPGGFVGANQLTAGSWSGARNQVVLLDTLNDVLRAYGAGQAGAGDVIEPVGPLSASGSGDIATMVEVDNGACAGGFQPVGVGLAGTGNLVPRLRARGCATLGGSVTLEIDQVRGGAQGLIFAGFSEGALPFRGGTVYMGSLDVVLNVAVGGNAGEAGAGAVTLPALQVTDPNLIGARLLVQAGFNDPAAVLGSSLTQAVRIEFE